MSDQIFENPRLVNIYDAFDGARNDLEPYVELAKSLNARSIIDVGCGTGSFACLLSEHGFDVTGVDPAQKSLEFARGKANSDQVRWILGDAACLPPLNADLAVMTGNVAQVFLTDDDWKTNLKAVHRALRPAGHLVFETRDPEQKTWLNWTPEKTYQRIVIPDIGLVEGWCEVINVSGELVNFRWNYLFESDGKTISSNSTLRFRSKKELITSLEHSGYIVEDIRDASDRPKQEFVFLCKTSFAV